MIHRRTFLAATAAGLTLTGAAALGLAQTAAPASATPAPAAATGPTYKEFIVGDPKAPVTVIEYASLTCNHCAMFHQTVYAELKKNYIDTGKARFVFRDFPLDGLAMGAAVLARCAPGDRGIRLVEMMFKNQDAWIRASNPLEPLKGYAQLAGMDSAAVDACLANQEMIKAVREVQTTASNLYKVQSTPTFFIEDDKIEGNRGYDYMAELIDKHYDKKK